MIPDIPGQAVCVNINCHGSVYFSFTDRCSGVTFFLNKSLFSYAIEQKNTIFGFAKKNNKEQSLQAQQINTQLY